MKCFFHAEPISVIGTCIFSAIIASFGVEFIVKFSVPVLLILYPITIILIILHILGINNRKTFKYSIYLSIFISLLQLGVTQFNIISFNKILYMLPFYNSGFPWLMPFTFVLIITNYKYKTK
jgi:LIVCS family branched-chain amino acid:cation transporter